MDWLTEKLVSSGGFWNGHDGIGRRGLVGVGLGIELDYSS